MSFALDWTLGKLLSFINLEQHSDPELEVVILFPKNIYEYLYTLM